MAVAGPLLATPDSKTEVVLLLPSILERDNRRQERAQHPEIRAQIEVMKAQVMEYQALAASIKSFEERQDSQGRTRSTCLIGKFLRSEEHTSELQSR